MNQASLTGGATLHQVDIYSVAPPTYSAASLAGITLLVASFAVSVPARADHSGFQARTSARDYVIQNVIAEDCCEYDESRIRDTDEDEDGATGIIDRMHRIVTNNVEREEGEPAPSQETCETLVNLLRDTENLVGYVPMGDVATFYGEISVTWRNGDHMVSVFVDSSGTSIHYGKLTKDGVGGYANEPLAGAAVLAAKLKALRASTQALNVGGGNSIL